MKKLCLLIALMIVFAGFSNSAFAQKVSVRIAPAEIISTHNDEVEVGDWIQFEVVNDVFVDSNLFIRKDTPIQGVVDFYDPNGWSGDYAEIRIKKFETVDTQGKKVEIESVIIIDGRDLKIDTFKKGVIWVLSNFRGREVFLEPDSRVYNLFLIK